MEYKKTIKNTVVRGAKKASYDIELVNNILDDAEICNVAFNVEGNAQVQSINFGRSDNRIYLHGSLKNRMTNILIETGKVCLSITHLDSMKLSKSAFHHSVNYRSVVVFGKVRELTTSEEKLEGLKAIINHFIANRWENCRKPNEKELKATRVIEITIEQASAKTADSPVYENKEDENLEYWSGQIPVKTICEKPISEDEKEMPKHIAEFYEKRRK